MRKMLKARILEEARYYIDNNSTLRATALHFGVSKSTIHKDLCTRLWDISYPLSIQVEAIINKNIAERALRGGMATKEKYINLKKQV